MPRPISACLALVLAASLACPVVAQTRVPRASRAICSARRASSSTFHTRAVPPLLEVLRSIHTVGSRLHVVRCGGGHRWVHRHLSESSSGRSIGRFPMLTCFTPVDCHHVVPNFTLEV